MNSQNFKQVAISSNTDKSLPTAIVLADQLVSGELHEIFGGIESASLVLAGKTLIEHILLELQELNFDQCIVLAGENAGSVQTLVGSDGRWGMTVTVMNYSRTVEQVLREFKSLSDENGLLVLEANLLRSTCVNEFLSRAFDSEYTLLEAQDAKGLAGITLLKPTKADFVTNAMPISIDSMRVNSLSSAKDFHQANFDIIAGVYQGLEPAVVINTQVGRRQHWTSHVSKGVRCDWQNVMIDKHCQVGKRASLQSVILNHDVYVEDKAQIQKTIVMPNSIISAKYPIVNAIIHRDAVFQL